MIAMVSSTVMLWLPFIAFIHRGAVWIAALLLVGSKPQINRSVRAWLFVAWALCGVLWAPEPVRSLRALVALACFLLLVPSNIKRLPSKFLIQSALLAAGIVALMIYAHDPASRSVTLQYTPFALTLSFVAALRSCWLLLALSLFVGWVVDCDTAILMTLIVAMGRRIPLVWLKKMWRGMWVFLFIANYGSQYLTHANIQNFERVCPIFSYVHRLHIYREVSQLIKQSPLRQKILGAGFDSSRFLGKETFEFSFDFQKKETHISQKIPIHPHNMILQIALELGLVGLLLALIGLWKIPFYNRSQMLVGFVAAGQACISVGIWQTWWMATIWIAYWLASKEE